MFKKCKLKRKINASKKKIDLLEKKRTRSQSALVDAILKKETPGDTDVDFFNMYSERIEAERKNLQQYTEELNELK